MPNCKNSHSDQVTKNGFVRSKQHYRCKLCAFNFIEGDGRKKSETAIKRAFAVILYALGKSSYGFIAKLFGVTPAAVQKWLSKEADLLSEPEISGEIRKMAFDEMWHFIGSKKNKKWIIKAVDRATGRTIS